MDSVHVLHLGCVSSVYLASKPGQDADQKVVKAYHKGHLQPRHWLNITREVTHLRQLKELGVPGVVDLCGTSDDSTNVYLVFEPCFGGDLYKRLAHKGLYDEARLCKEVVVPLLKVLRSLHQLGIIHRDIKPENVFFQSDGSLTLGDFGLAVNATRERPISRVGTLDYMAPEVLAQPSADVIALRKIKPTQLPSYDCKVDIWALGVLVHEALTGVTPFHDADPQAASLRAQFRPPMAMPPGVSAACADFVAQALAKQAAQRPSAAQLLAHPWVQAHVTAQDMLLQAEQAAVHRAGSLGALSRTSSGSQATPKGGGAGQLPIALSRASSTRMPGSIGSSCELSSSAPTASPAMLSTASSFGVGLAWQPMAGTTLGFQPGSPLAAPKPQPLQTQPQQLPPHPFAAAAAQYGGTARMLLGPVSPTSPLGHTADGTTFVLACPAPRQEGGSRAGATAPLAILVPQAQARPRFSRQLSSPARLRDAPPPQEAERTQTPTSPLPSSSGARFSALAMSPMRALLGAGRNLGNLARLRSGAGAPAADGSVLVSSRAPIPCPPAASGFSMRSPLPSPIRGLLQSNRRKPAQASSAASLFAAAQWKPGGILASTSGGSGDGGGGSSSIGDGGSAADSVCGAPKGLDCSGFMRACSMGPNTVLGAGVCSTSQGGSTGPGPSDDAAGSRGSSHAAAAVAAVGAHATRPPGLACGPGGSGEQQGAALQKQQLALLNRYPSAPDPGPLLALSPVRGGPAKAAGVPPVPAPMDRAGSQGMRGVWLKVQGVCKMVSKQCPRETTGQQHDAHCTVSKNA